MLEPIDISGQIPSSFYSQMDSKKWSDRKEALETIEKITATPRILDTDLGDLVRLLKKTIAKDTNLVVVTSAAKCMCQLAQGMRTSFAPYASSTLTTMFDKFKEKRPNVVAVFRDATDAAFVGTCLENAGADIIEFLNSKNPQIKSEMALFCARVFANFPNQASNKKVSKPIIEALVKTLSDMDATVRESSAQAIGTAMKVVGEKSMMTLLADVEPIKVTKVKEYCDKAEIKTDTDPSTDQYLIQGHIAQSTNGQQNLADCQQQDDEEETDPYDALEPIDISGQIPSSFYSQMDSKKWSDRKEALETIEKITATPRILDTDLGDLVRLLKKTIAKDTNLVVVTSAAKCMCQLAQGMRTSFAPYASSTLTTMFDKFKEKRPNVVAVFRDVTDAAFVGTCLENAGADIIEFLNSKNPQIKSEMALFCARVFANFPGQVTNKKNLKPIIEALLKTLSDMDATVRENSAQAIGTAMKVIGEKSIMTLLTDVEPIKITKIKEYCEKAEVKKLPKAVIAATKNHQASTLNSMHPRSTATMVKSTSNSKLKSKLKQPVKSTGYGPQTTINRGAASNGNLNKNNNEIPKISRSSLGNSTATVKRTATIVKPKGTVPKPPAAQAATIPVNTTALHKTNGSVPHSINLLPNSLSNVMSSPVPPVCHIQTNGERSNNIQRAPLTPIAPNLNSYNTDMNSGQTENLEMAHFLTRLLTEYNNPPLNAPAVEYIKSGIIKSLRSYERCQELQQAEPQPDKED